MLEGSDRVNGYIYHEQSFSSYISTYCKAGTTVNNCGHQLAISLHSYIQKDPADLEPYRMDTHYTFL